MNTDPLSSASTAPLSDLDTEIQQHRFPNLVSRVKAVFIDFVILLTVFAVASVVIGLFDDVSDFIKGFIAIAMMVFYDPLMTAFTGGTLGHKVIGLRVKKYGSTDQNISLINAFFRFIVKASLGWLSFLTVTSSKSKRAIHDTLSGSIVLQ